MEYFQEDYSKTYSDFATSRRSKHLILTLPNSAPYLQRVLSQSLTVDGNCHSSALHRSPTEIDIGAATAKHFRPFVDRYFSLSFFEARVEKSHLAAPTSIAERENRLKFASKIDTFL